MKNLVGCALMPHPPLIIPEVGKDELEKIQPTVNAMTKVAHAFKQANPETIVIITPHGPVFKDAVTVTMHPRIRGNMAKFGAPDTVLAFETDDLLIRRIIKNCARLGVNLLEMTDTAAKSYHLSLELDHGAFVPLYYLHKAGFKGQIVHLCVGMLSYEEMYTFGKAVQLAIDSMDKKVAVIASGDLSHRLTPDAPAGYNPCGPKFDELLVAALKNSDAKALFNMDSALVENAGECGLRPAFFLMGIMGGLEAKVETASYEGPFGVGYAVISYSIVGKKQNCKNLEKKSEQASESVCSQEGRGGESLNPVALAKDSLRYYLENRTHLPKPATISPYLAGQAGVFVSIKKSGALRGCIGTFLPTKPTIAEEIIQNAVSAAISDPRFQPITLNEFDDLEISVDILSLPEQVDSLAALDPKKYGVIVRQDHKSGLLLPDLDGVDTAEIQVAIALKKAGIPSNANIDLYRFSVTRHT